MNGTDFQEYSIYVSSLISILMLIILILEHKKYQLDRYRQRLFKLRDSFFVRAEKGELSFDDKAYKLTRELMNSHIRFAHRTTFFHVLVYLRLAKKLEKLKGLHFHERLDLEIEKLDEKQGAIIKASIVELHILFISHVVRHSLFIRFMLLPFFVFYILGDIAMLLTKSLRNLLLFVLRFSWDAFLKILLTANVLSILVVVLRRVLVDSTEISQRKIIDRFSVSFEESVERLDEAAVAI